MAGLKKRGAARSHAPLIAACTAGAVLAGAGALFARLRSRRPKASGAEVITATNFKSSLHAEVAPEGTTGQDVYHRSLEIQVYRPWHAYGAAVVQERSGWTAGASDGCSSAMKTTGTSEAGDLCRSFDDDTAACDSYARRSVAAARASVVAATVASDDMLPASSGDAKAARAAADPLDPHQPRLGARGAAAVLLMTTPLRPLAPAAAWSMDEDIAAAPKDAAAAAVCSVANSAAASNAEEQQPATQSQPAPADLALAAVPALKAPAAHPPPPSPPCLPQSATGCCDVAPQLAIMATEAEAPGDLGAESSWDQPQSWCGEDSEPECELELERPMGVDAEAAAQEEDGCEEFFSQYENAAFDEQQHEQLLLHEHLPGAPAAVQSALSAYGGSFGCPFAPPTPCSSFHMRDNDVFDASSLPAGLYTAAAAAIDGGGDATWSPAAALAAAPAEKEQLPQLPRTESFVPATPALSVCPSLARSDSSVLASPSRAASLRSLSSSCRAASARRALWLVCAEEDGGAAEVGNEEQVIDGASPLAASAEATFRGNPLFFEVGLTVAPAASAAASSSRCSALGYDNPCFAAEADISISLRGEEAEHQEEEAQEQDFLTMAASSAAAKEARSAPEAPPTPSLASPALPLSPSPDTRGAAAGGAPSDAALRAPPSHCRRTGSCPRGSPRAATAATPQARPAWRPNGTKAGSVPQRCMLRVGAAAAAPSAAWTVAASRSRSGGAHRAMAPGAPRYLAPTAAFLASARVPTLKRSSPPLAAAAKAVAAAAAAARPPFRPASKYSKTAADKPAQRSAAGRRADPSNGTSSSREFASSGGNSGSGARGGGTAAATADRLPSFMRPTAAFLAATASAAQATSLRVSSGSGASSTSHTGEDAAAGTAVRAAAVKRPVWR